MRAQADGHVHDDDDAPDTPPKNTEEGTGASVLEARWLPLSDTPAVLQDEPPPEEWLLTRWGDRHDEGVLRRGRAGVLAATGGVGKTMALIQLAIAVASGGCWLGTFRAARGHVLLALAEEDLDEARRRLWRACNALELSRDERAAIAARIDLLPLAGVPVALTASAAPGLATPTELANELRKRLVGREVDWALVVLDPLSRWAGGGVEANNEIATRFVQIVETLTTVRGAPTVLVAHHSSKTSARGGNSDARGVTAIRDGFRWMASLDSVEAPDGSRAVRLRNGKSNYSLVFDDVLLLRSDEPGCEGTLRAATDAEQEPFGIDEAAALSQQRDDKRARRAEMKVLSAAAAVATVIAAQPGIVSRNLAPAVRSLAPGVSREQARTGLHRLGSAVETVEGKRRALHHYLNGSALPVEVVTYMEGHMPDQLARVRVANGLKGTDE